MQIAMYVYRRLYRSASSATTRGRTTAPRAANIWAQAALSALLGSFLVMDIVQEGIHWTEAQVPTRAIPARSAPRVVNLAMPGAKMSTTLGFGPVLVADFHFSDSGTKIRMKKVSSAGTAPAMKSRRQSGASLKK